MSRIAFTWHPAAWRRDEARWTIESIAPLLDAPWRHVAPGAAPEAGEVVVRIGPRSPATADVAAHIVFEQWPAWHPATLGLGRLRNLALPCPDGACPAPGHAGEWPEPWLRALAFLLSREEERSDPRRDQWQCYSGFYTRLHELGVLGTALFNHHAAALRQQLDAWCSAQHRTLPREPRWPHGAAFAAALTHDVDDVQLYSLPQALRLLAQVRSPRSYALRGGLTAVARAVRHVGADDPYWNLDRWSALESEHGFRSTFYICAPQPSRRHEYDALYALDDRVRFESKRVSVADVLRGLAGRGFEVGLHGSYQSYRDAAELALQKRQIEAAVGQPITGTRQHFLRFDVHSTFAAQVQAGLTCDSTLGYNETPGFRAGIAAPFRPWNAEANAPHALLELPLTCMDGALFRSLGLSPDAAIAATLGHLDEVESAGGLAGLLWHPNAAATALFPGWWDCYVAALMRLRARGAWAAPARDIETWWRERELRLAAGGGAGVPNERNPSL